MVGVTGLGSLPGTDFPAAVAMTFDELVLPYLPELPARGPHATMIARGAATLAGIDSEFTVSGWRLAPRPGGDLRRARALLRDDLDRLAETVGDYEGPLRVGVAGPWTLAAALELPRGGRVLADTGARRDLVAALREGTDTLLREVRRRLPGAEPSLQLDEPSLPAVLGGGIPSPGGYFRVRAIDEQEAFTALRSWSPAEGCDAATVVHCCAPGLPVRSLLQATGLRGVCLDAAMVGAGDIDDLAAVLDGGHALLLGVTDSPATTVSQSVERAWRVLKELDPGPELADVLTVTPACGLAGWPLTAARTVWRTLTEVAGRLEDRLTS
jgi:methionine synthase II (cobalamin-independent)